MSQLFSDDATSFQKAAKEIKFLFDSARSEETQSFLAQRRTTWKFNTARAPWRSGFVERNFRSLKEPMRKAIGQSILSYEEFETSETDLEKIINDKPLTTVGTNQDEPTALTPSDLLCGYKTNPALPEPQEILTAMDRARLDIFSERWKLQQQILNHFWKRFRSQYFGYLKLVHTSLPVKSKSIKVRDVVLLDDPAASRSYWPIAVVQAISGGRSPTDASGPAPYASCREKRGREFRL